MDLFRQLFLPAADGALDIRLLVRTWWTQSEHVHLVPCSGARVSLLSSFPSPTMRLNFTISRHRGTKLKIISETLNVGGRIANMRCEVSISSHTKPVSFRSLPGKLTVSLTVFADPQRRKQQTNRQWLPFESQCHAESTERCCKALNVCTKRQ